MIVDCRDAMRRGGMLLREVFKGNKWTASKFPEETLKKDYLATIGMWEKGEAIAGVFRGVKTPPSFREIARETERDHKALKKWHDLKDALRHRQEIPLDTPSALGVICK